MTGRIPIRSALSEVIAPGDSNWIRPAVPTIAEFYQKNGYTTYMSGKWHLGDKPAAYNIAQLVLRRNRKCPIAAVQTVYGRLVQRSRALQRSSIRLRAGRQRIYLLWIE
jgi:arylsulfatase A-like enzyme